MTSFEEIKSRVEKAKFENAPKGTYCLLLCGSRAAGCAMEGSDIDFLVIDNDAVFWPNEMEKEIKKLFTRGRYSLESIFLYY